uniref:No apical meristem-associated C-terminal domain-containing protein n=1 Tax=Arundo donax TaxID=35708 RepID=A0A0A9HMY2_ARUDO
MDAAQGNEQPCSTYWMRIHSYLHDHKDFKSDRNHTSLMHRWGDIQRAINKFASCMADVQCRKPSGMTERDKIAEAMKIFRGRDAKDGEPFKFLHYWPLM